MLHVTGVSADFSVFRKNTFMSQSGFLSVKPSLISIPVLGESRDLALGTRLFKLCVGGAQGRCSAGASAAGAQAEDPVTPGASG